MAAQNPLNANAGLLGSQQDHHLSNAGPVLKGKGWLPHRDWQASAVLPSQTQKRGREEICLQAAEGEAEELHHAAVLGATYLLVQLPQLLAKFFRSLSHWPFQQPSGGGEGDDTVKPEQAEDRTIREAGPAGQPHS